MNPSLPAPASAPPVGYLAVTRTATYGFLAALPLFVLYEALIWFVNLDDAAGVRVSSDVWLKVLLAAVGVQGWAMLSGVLLALGAGILWWERKRRIPLVPRYFGWMVGESLAYAVVLAFLVSGAVGLLFAAHGAPVPLRAMQGLAQLDLPTQLALSLGAGLYEELVFRVLLVGGLFAGLRLVWPQGTRAYLVAAVVGALLFSAVHYTGFYGDPFRLDSFTFRFLFGLALNAVYLVRGFGCAAWTHALYDVLVVTRLL